MVVKDICFNQQHSDCVLLLTAHISKPSPWLHFWKVVLTGDTWRHQ